MQFKTETLTMPLMHVYYLTNDSANNTGYTVEEVLEMIKEHGSDHKIEITVTTPVPEPQPEVVDVVVTEVEEEIS
jgi:hypothetical protein